MNFYRNVFRFELEDGFVRTAHNPTPQGPTFFIATSEMKGLTFGIDNPSGLSNKSRGLIGQFLGFLAFEILENDFRPTGKISWWNQRKKFKAGIIIFYNLESILNILQFDSKNYDLSNKKEFALVDKAKDCWRFRDFSEQRAFLEVYM
jgi:hypothetical protein